MGNAAVAAQEYWGYLIKPDRTPAPLLEQLLLGIANYINKHIAPWDVRCLTPTKLAAFYRLVGGNYDSLFLEPPHGSLSFIYRSLGCYHTLQPDKDPFEAPSIPALTPQGFVKWQTVQLLLQPEEHVPFLQEALKRFEIKNSGEGGEFPSILPREALPKKADAGMLEWHDNALETLRPKPEFEDASRATEAAEEVESLTDSSVDVGSIVDADDYFEPRDRHRASSPSQPNVIHVSPTTREPRYWQAMESPSQPVHYRRSRSHEMSPREDLLHRDGPTPTGFVRPRTPRTTYPRTPSPLSSTSGSAEDDDPSNSEASLGPVPVPELRHRQSVGPQFPIDLHGRRHSAHNPLDPRDYVISLQRKHPHTLSPPFYAHVRPQSQPGLFQEITPPRRTDVDWHEPGYGPSSFYNRSSQSRERPNVRFVDADRDFREERMRKRSNGTGR
ncbi:MAG: hypothetical protein Q9187_000709 [Circinaria calcarea]